MVNAQEVIARALALSEAATDGPWGLTGGGEYVTGVSLVVAPDDGGVTIEDAEFIAAARTLLPALAKALGDVLDLHRQDTAYGVAVCAMCAQVKDADEWDDPSSDYAPVASWLPFPCPTVRAITAALSEVTP